MAVTLAGGRQRHFTADHTTDAGGLALTVQTPRFKCILRLHGVRDWLVIILGMRSLVETVFRLIIEAEQLRFRLPHMDEEGFQQYSKRDG